MLDATHRRLDDIRIATPCSADWDAMEGDERVRFCADCRLHVYNLAAMTPDEALTFIDLHEGRTCVRLYRRADGTVLARDCPLGLRAVRRRAVRAAAFGVSVLLASVGAWLSWTRPALEALAHRLDTVVVDDVLMGEVMPDPHFVMGDMVAVEDLPDAPAIPLPVRQP